MKWERQMKFGAAQSVPHRGVLVFGIALLLLSSFVAAPVFTHSSAAENVFGSPAFGTLWGSIEPVVPNFWGPTVRPALQEPYREATNGSRLVQYFDKARMEQTTASGSITNGLLTVELITGQRQIGDAAFAAFPPSTLPIVGDPTNPWPPYAALGGGVFAAKVAKSGEPFGTVYKPDGAFGLNPGLAADPGAQYGIYQSDPGGKYGHNIPLAFSSYLAALPIPWLPAMGLPLTEPFWVNVKVGGALTWVLVQPYERRVLSYTPSNPPGFRVEMGNIGQHYSIWRYGSDAATGDGSATGGATTSSVTTTTVQGTPTLTVSGTPRPLAISSVQFGLMTESAFSLTFKTSVPATTEILYGTASHSYTSRQDISTTAAQDHAASLTDLQAGTKYFYALQAIAGADSIQSKETFFTTAGAASPTDPAARVAIATKTPNPSPATATNTPKSMSPIATTVPKNVLLHLRQIRVGVTNSAQFALPADQNPRIPAALLESATVALSLAYDGSANPSADTVAVSTWTRDMANLTATGAGPTRPLALADKHVAVTMTATATIPFTDTSSPPIVVTFTRKILPADYAAGITITSSSLSNSRTPGFNVTLIFSVALIG